MILGPVRVEPREEEMGVQRRIEKSMTKATGLFFNHCCTGLKIMAGQLQQKCRLDQPKVQVAGHVDSSRMS